RKDVSPGFKFKDADMLGMPWQVIVSEKNLKKDQVELKERKSAERTYTSVGEAVEKITQLLA
ncbi:MAG: His/Gly/Thr/Pro-type tRNA ligase C-terminal domain-containing protein, partial [Bacteroidota bacterium]